MSWSFLWLFQWLIAIVKWLFPTKLEVTRMTLKVNDLSQSCKIVHITDIHYDGPNCSSPRITTSMLDDMVNIANQESPDLVVITGDFVQSNPEPIQALAKNWLSKLKPTYGVYGVLGNHDDKHAHSRTLITEKLTVEGNVHVLENACASPMGNKAGDLMVIGFGDFTHKNFHIPPVEKELLDSSRPKLVLTHHPDSADLLRNYRADVILAGHTHGGQILLPLIGTPLRYLKGIQNLIPRKFRRKLPTNVLKNWKWIKGLHIVPQITNDNTHQDKHSNNSNRVNNNYLFVNRGLATHPPFRFNCHPEIAIITLVPT